MAQRKAKGSIYQLRIDLNGIRPPIWRRILVPGNTKLSELSEILLAAMGWYGYHLHQFIVDGIYYGEPDPDDYFDVEDEKKVTLQQIAHGVGNKFKYEYDFGDSWEHTVKVEALLEPEEGMTYPVCIKGKRACPPEDVGGVWGYEELLETLGDPDSEENEEMLEWVGDDFDPEEFNLEEVNSRMQSRI